MITQSEHDALTWAVNWSERQVDQLGPLLSSGSSSAINEWRGRIFEARRFLAREAPAAATEAGRTAR